MPELIPTNKFLEDLERFRREALIRKKIAKALSFLESNPLYPGLHLERIVNDESAWAIRVDLRFGISLDPEGYLTSGDPDWAKPVLLLRIFDHDDLYKHPR